MKLSHLFLGLATLATIATTSCKKGLGGSKLANETDSVSYCIGLTIGKNLKGADIPDFNSKVFADAVNESMAGKDPKIADEAAQAFIQQYFQKLQVKVAAKNIKEGQEFLAKNKTKAGVKTTASGLQYEVITEGTGAMPKAEETVTVHYHGTLIDGKVFDSSVDRKEPASFPVNRVIPGWTEALQMMKVGSKWKIYIPSELAYGERPMGEKIKPNSVLIFEVELLGIEAPKPEEKK